MGDEIILKKNNIIHKILWNTYNLHIICIKYDENLPTYFNNNHTFLWKRMNKRFLNKTKLFEKQEIKWFSIHDMKKHRGQFRAFYRNIVDILLKDRHIIYNKVKQLHRKKPTVKKYNKYTHIKKTNQTQKSKLGF